MFSTPSQSEEATHYESQNKNQYDQQQKSQPNLDSTQLLSDLAMRFGDVQIPQLVFPSQKPGSAHENASLSNLSLENSFLSDESSLSLHKWFDDFNQNPEKGFSGYRDSGSPYFLQRNSLSSPRENLDIAQLPELTYGRGSGSIDDYRSVIDDLTIENKKLRKKLRRYKKQSNKQLEKDKLFEIRIHDLPPVKRRELETALRSFASSLDIPGCQFHSSLSSSLKQSVLSEEATLSSTIKSSSTSTSNSQLEQSNFSSTVTSTLPTTVNSEFLIFGGKNRSCFNPSPDNQQNLLPSHRLKKMSERQKKKLVVQRLEQLFTGGKGSNRGMPSQTLNQQENSKSAIGNEPLTTVCGIREAHMIPQENFKDPQHSGSLNDPEGKPSSDLSDEANSDSSISNQRPTRPLELDPDRTQIPSDNVEYIRHLGLSTPQLASEESTDATKERGGWVYLNLLINMAQLHIINVTPDFVRSAVVDVSEKFQLSSDGQKLRWKGGSKGTYPYSENNSSISQDRESPITSRQNVHRFMKIEKQPAHHLKSNSRNKPQCISSEFHYKPIFNHRSSSENTSESSESISVLGHIDESMSSQNPVCHSRNNRGQRVSASRKQCDDSSLVFYRGADFCVDLSGDPYLAFLQLSNHDSEEDSDRGKNVNTDSKVLRIERTRSGSLLPYRPFKDSDHLDPLNMQELEIFPNSEDSSSYQLDLNTFPSDSQQRPPSLQAFEPSGIGGSHISDHFEIRVLTCQMTSRTSTSGRQSKDFTNIEQRLKSRICGLSIGDLVTEGNEDYTNNCPTSVNMKSLPSNSSCQKATLPMNLPVQKKIISSDLINLPPSKLPSPLTLQYSTDSDAESDFSV